MKTTRLLVVLCGLLTAVWAGAAEPVVQAEVKNVSVSGNLSDETARLVIEARLKGLLGEREKPIFATALQHSIHATLEKLSHTFRLQIDVIEGAPKEFALVLSGEGELRSVTGDRLQDWSIREEAGGVRYLVLRPQKADPPVTNLVVTVTAETKLKELPLAVTPLALVSTQPALGHGYVVVDADPAVDVEVPNPTGVVPIETKFLPEELRPQQPAAGMEPLAFRFQGAAYTLPLKVAIADPEARKVVLRNFRLVGQLGTDNAAFTLTATASVKNPKGGSLNLLSGGAALTEATSHADWRLRFQKGRFVATFDQPGEYPLEIKFNAAVRSSNDWSIVDFAVAPSALQPVVFPGLKADTQFQFRGAAKPERTGDDFTSFLPPDGRVRLAWKQAKPEAEGTLFYAAEVLSQIAIGPGLMRQTALFDFKVMQGEMNRVSLLVQGAGEITRVQGPQVLAWTVEAVPGSADRRLNVQFNQAQKDQFSLQVQMQTPLGAFPQTTDAMQLRPEGATRFGGYFRIVNEGAVRLEVVQSGGLSQISPEQFPQTDLTKAMVSPQTTQTFAYRFAGGAFQLRLQADNILPEVAVSQVLVYHLGETDSSIDAEIELDVREAPLREALLRVPKGYSVARLNASGLSDWFLVDDPADATAQQLRLVYSAPVTGRQVVQLALERNQALGETTWSLPRVEVLKAKSVRGHVGVTADAGFRLTATKTQALTEIATAFFPKKLAGLQAAFRLSDPAWQLSLNVERLPQSIQADAFHLFSVGEGIAYGSSLVNYLISGAPVATFKVELSDEYFNVEFTGKDIRNWQKVQGGYQVQLHTPVSGTYTLLAAYERPFKAQGEKLAFTGARPLDAQSEQGYTVLISTYQFQVQSVNLSAGLLPLEPGEVPAEYRLFFDAPILAAYRYTSRPFNLELQLLPLAQAETVSQVVDRAMLTTRISEEGQVVTDARYFVKNKGAPNLRLVLPEGLRLWSVTVNGAAVVPVTDDRANLIPLPQHADPNALNDLQIKLAAKASNPNRLTVAAPVLSAPILLAEWKLEPDTGKRLIYRGGTLTPAGVVPDVSGYAGLFRLLKGGNWLETVPAAGAAFVLLLIAAVIWRVSTTETVSWFSLRHWLGGLLGLAACALAVGLLLWLAERAQGLSASLPRDLTFIAPVQQAGSTLTIDLANASVKPSVFGQVWSVWPVVVAAVVWLYAVVSGRAWFRWLGPALGWTLIFWAALRSLNGAPTFFYAVLAFVALQLALPALRRWWQVPRKAGSSPTAGSVAATTALVLLGVSLLMPGMALAGPVSDAAKALPLAESVVGNVRVDEDFVFATAKIRWSAIQGQQLPVLHAPGVLTRIDFSKDAARLVEIATDSGPSQVLVADTTGPLDVSLEYQTQVTRRDGERGFALPTQYGLVNRLDVSLTGLDVDLAAPQAVAVQRSDTAPATNSVFSVVLAPVNDAWIGWKPRSRDTRREKAVFYAEVFQLYVPSAGVVEGLHQVQIRPAQGQLGELTFSVPAGATITDVAAVGLSLWRFDPETHKLRVSLTPAQSKPFAVLVKSQVATGPLPFEKAAGLITVDNAAGQIGLIGVATGSEVQLADVQAEAFSPINLKDFPAAVLDPLRGAISGLTLRRAFRYSEPKGTLTLKAAPVEPDVRVEAQQTLSLGEDRVLLAATLDTEITRAGIFKLSFLLPAGMDVESISSAAMSHWTELKTDEGRLITLHLKTKTDGQQQFSVSLAGPGVRAATNWAVPRLVLREASKQRGQLLIVPEQGMRLQVVTRDGVTQLDPLKAGVRQKGVLAFRLLQADWKLALDLERVDAWIQVTSLQHATVTEAQVTVAANLQYQIENTGVKALRVVLPANAENVRFRGDQVSDFRQPDGQTNTVTREWEIKLNRRVIGKYLLQVNYSQPLAANATEATLVGTEALGVNLQRGFVTVQAGGRLQVRIAMPPTALQPAEWQSIPRVLQQDIQASAANYTFRLVEPAFSLPLRLERHEAARLLPARVSNVTLTSVLSDDGVMLTQARLQLIPGDKRLLHFTLPADAKFWFAFVNDNSVWPWRQTNEVLIPLEQHSKTGEPTTVEFYFSSRTGLASARWLDLELLGPRFDLPLEDIAWRVYLSDKWQLRDWSGTLQFQEQKAAARPVAVDFDTYRRTEVSLQRAKSQEAEQFLTTANSLLAQGDPEQARRAFQNAYGLSQHDSAFNEDARVQLHNLKMQQALVGLNFRQAKVAGESGALANTPRGLREGQTQYTQQEAKQLIERNTAEENAVQMRLAERLIQQQDAAVASPAAIRASIPEQGRLLTFTRPLQVDTWADLKIGLEASAARPTGFGAKLLLLAAVFILAALLANLAHPRRREVRPGA